MFLATFAPCPYPRGGCEAPELSPLCGTIVARDVGPGCGAWSGWIRAGFGGAACETHEGLHFVCQALTCESKWRAARLVRPRAERAGSRHPPSRCHHGAARPTARPRWGVLHLYIYQLLLKAVDLVPINIHPPSPGAVPVSQSGPARWPRGVVPLSRNFRRTSVPLDQWDKIKTGLMTSSSESFLDFIVHNLDPSRVIYTWGLKSCKQLCDF